MEAHRSSLPPLNHQRGDLYIAQASSWDRPHIIEVLETHYTHEACVRWKVFDGRLESPHSQDQVLIRRLTDYYNSSFEIAKMWWTTSEFSSIWDARPLPRTNRRLQKLLGSLIGNG